MQHLCRRLRLWLALGLLLWCFAGCAEGPLGLARLNPWLTKKWQEDEKYGPTFHRRLSDLRALRSSAGRLDAQQRERVALEMSTLVQSDPNPVLRGEAIGVLGELGGPTVQPALTAGLSDADVDVRIAACRALGTVGGAVAVTQLAEVYQRDADVDVRLAAIRQLGKFRDSSAVQALGNALDDSDPAVQHMAVQSLKEASGQDFGDSVPAWRDYVQGRTPRDAQSRSLVQRFFSVF